MLKKKEDIIVLIAVVVIVLVAIFYFAGKSRKAQSPVVNGNNAATSNINPANNSAPVGSASTSKSTSNNQQSNPVPTNNIPTKAVKLTVTTAGFSPSSFTVGAGKSVTLSITAGDSKTHVFVFDSTLLSAVAVGVGPGETRLITFNAPKVAGTYKFHSNVPGQSGEKGVMIVK